MASTGPVHKTNWCSLMMQFSKFVEGSQIRILSFPRNEIYWIIVRINCLGVCQHQKYSVWIPTENLLSSNSVPNADRDYSATNPKLSTLQRSSCSTPLSQTNRYTKEQDYRPKAAGRKTPTLAPPVPGTPFLRPVHQVPLVPHVPIVRPAHQLHPGLVQRMLAQGIHPQHLPSLLQAGEFLTWHDNSC